jgi:hypothetical protein
MSARAAKLVAGVCLLALPFIISIVAPNLGTRRGAWITFAGVAIAAIAERPLRPKWWARDRIIAPEWWMTAFVLAVAIGLMVSLLDAVLRGASLRGIAAQSWIPVYRSLVFAAGLTLVRQARWDAADAERARAVGLAESNASPV